MTVKDAAKKELRHGVSEYKRAWEDAGQLAADDDGERRKDE